MKVCAEDATWSALKFVYRIEDRSMLLDDAENHLSEYDSGIDTIKDDSDDYHLQKLQINVGRDYLR